MKLQNQRGFTIVELLIVVVVIAILAAITIVSYTGIQQRANSAALQTEVSQAVTKIEALKSSLGTDLYPADAAAAGITSSTLTYYNDPVNNTYCVQSKKSGVVYSANNTATTAALGDCTERGLIGWWQLNNSPNDTSTNGLSGTNTGPPTSITGADTQADHAYEYTATNTAYTTVSNNSLVNDAQTFSMWIKPYNWSSPTASAMLAKRSTSTAGFLIAYLNATSTMIFDCGGSGGSNRYSPGYAPTLNVWTHIVFTCSTAGGVAFYANGVPAGTSPTRSTVDRSSTSSTAMRFGQDSTSSTLQFNGGIDDVRIYARTLTAAEIALLYANGAK